MSQQTITVIQKTIEMKSTYYQTKFGLLTDNSNDDIYLVLRNGDFEQMPDLETGLKRIRWDKSSDTTVENISWLSVVVNEEVA